MRPPFPSESVLRALTLLWQEWRRVTRYDPWRDNGPRTFCSFPLGARFLVPGVIQPSWHKQRLSHEEAFIWLLLVTYHWKGKGNLSKNNSLAVSFVGTGRKFLRNRETHAPILCALAVHLPPLQSGVLTAHWMWKTLGLKKLPSSTLHVSVTVRVQSILSEGKYCLTWRCSVKTYVCCITKSSSKSSPAFSICPNETAKCKYARRQLSWHLTAAWERRVIPGYACHEREGVLTGFHSQEWSISNFSRSCTRNTDTTQ